MGYLSCRAESAVSTANSQNPSAKTTAGVGSGQDKPIKIQHFEYSDLEAATNGFSEQKLLGKGSHGYVYKAVVRGRHVAVKRPSRPHNFTGSRPNSTPEITNEVDNEIEILSKIQNPRLVNLVGPPNWGRRIRLALQTAKAIDTLHCSNPPVIHRDIKSANVLIDRKLFSVYDPRISPPRDLIVRKQLAVVAAKCVRSCRERRPAMKDVVVWLSGLSKLVPLHSWNSFNNPCMMIENVGRPVEVINPHSNCTKFGGSERYGIRGKNLSQTCTDKNDVFPLRRNRSIGGGGAEICSRRDDIIPRTSFRSQGATAIEKIERSSDQ
ncbi:hypothetical protein G4B88_014999 [Cannabis sativa]|uniref:Protein kinase domain-containing protein n=1 Tax=Cannabis sativa TaxID=3483 RepID=A0A7J6DL97_CANSA|nr:hypothetical protein G4B88_014999 [Cannabis sativa]